MKNSTFSMKKIIPRVAALLLLASLAAGCAGLDRLTKPRVKGLQVSQNFDSASFVKGGVGSTRVNSSLAAGDEVNTVALVPVLGSSIRDKRRDVSVDSAGRYEVTANIIANDVSNRSNDVESSIYKWTSRRVTVSYVVVDGTTEEQVWSGVIETSEEALATYEKNENEKSSDRIKEAVAEAIAKREIRPYPAVPIFGDVVRRNFEGFALNLPYEK